MFKHTIPLLTLLPVMAIAQAAITAAPIEPPMVSIPAGEFRKGGGKPYMGPGEQDPRALPIHSVRVPAFKLGMYEVTVKEFRQFVQATGYKVPEQCVHEPTAEWFSAGPSAGSYDRNALTDNEFQPVVCMGFAGAQAYAEWLSAQTGKSYRLATEAEWEYAARAGAESLTPFGADANQVCAYANLSDRSGEHAALSRFGASYLGIMGGYTSCDDGAGFSSVVGMYKPNVWGLHDMMGNVSEWLQDCWKETYADAPTDGSAQLGGAGGGDCDRHVVRGGSWHHRHVSASSRGAAPMSWVGSIEGFRLAQSLSGPADTQAAPSTRAFERELKAAQDAERAKRKQRLAFPAAPKGLTVSPGAGTEIHLSWQANPEAGITGYHIYRTESMGSNDQIRIASDVKGLSYTDTSAPPRKHSYALVAVNRDVFSGLSERVHSADITQALPGRIQAEDFNQMSKARIGRINPNEDAEEPAAGLNLTGPGGVQKGSWTEYRINAPRAGSYRLTLRYAALRDSQGLRLSLNGQPLTTQALPSTGGGRKWQTLEGAPVILPVGPQLLRMEAVEDGWKLNWLRLE